MQARWAENKFTKNTELCFTVTLGNLADAQLRFIAKDIYNLFINGEFVQYGPARAAKGYAREEKLLLDKYLTKEENVICIYVQYNDTKTLCFAWEKPVFASEITAGGKTVAQTDDFACYAMTDKLQKVERMSFQRGYVEVYQMQKDREPFDFSAFPKCKLIPVELPKLLPRNVSMAKHGLVKGELIERGGVAIDPTKAWANDFTRQLDTGKNLFSFTRAECECVLSKELLAFTFIPNRTEEKLRYEKYAFDRTYCGKFRIQITVNEKTSLWLAYDDILIDGQVKFNREQIIHGLKWELEKGEYLLYSNEVYTAKYLAFVIDGDAEIHGAEMVRVENPDAERLQFTCEDKTLQSIVDAARHSFEHNGYDLLTDCPSRERAGYLCDGFFAARAEKFFCGENLVEKNLLENYALFKNEKFVHDGILPMCYPSEPSDENDYIPNWVLWYLLELEDYWLRTGDGAFVELHKSKVLAVLDYFQTKENEYGLLEDLDGWVFVEWSKANDFVDGVNFPSNMCYYSALKAAANLLGDGALYEKAERLKQTIIRLSYNGEFFVDNALREAGKLKLTSNVSETCQNYAAFFEIFTKAENPQFYDRLIGGLGCLQRETHYPEVHVANMFIGYVLRLSVLVRERAYEAVLAESKNRFADMARETGTIWELFQTNASCNHGFGAVLGQMLTCALTGFAGVNEKTGEIYFSKSYQALNCEVVFPMQKGVGKVTVNAGQREIDVPPNYRLQMVD
jgi:alpha-L-rhamnosidase